MAIIILQHAASEGPGRLGAVLWEHGKKVDVRRLDLPVGGADQNRHVPTDFDDVDGVISLGGPMMVGDDVAWMKPELEFLKAAHERKLPVVGVCLGAQLIAAALGGTVGAMEAGPEWGMLDVMQHPVANTDTILAGVAWKGPQLHCHGQEIKTLPAGVGGGATALQFSKKCKVQSFRAGLRTYGFQYHFECDMAMIRSWLSAGDPQMSAAGLDAKEGIAQAQSAYQEYARASERICRNLVNYLFPVSRAFVA